MINSREYHFLNKRSLNCIKATLAQRLVNWSTDWLTNDVACLIGDVEPIEISDRQELTDSKQLHYFEFDKNRWCVFVYEADFKFQISRSLLDIPNQLSQGRNEKKNLLDLVVDESISELSLQLIMDGVFKNTEKEAGISVDKIPDDAFYPGSGCFVADLVINSLKFKVIFSAGTADGCLTVSKPITANGALSLVDVDKSIGQQLVNSRVDLGMAELTLDELVTLQEGDVLTLNHNINDMLVMKFDESPISLSGYLGKTGDNKSFRVKSLANAENN